MLKRACTLVAAVVASISVLASPATSATITFYFGGTITSVSDPNGTLGGAVQVNDAWSGSYTFESTTPDSRPLDPDYGRYDSPTASMTTLLGTLMIEAEGSQCTIGVYDDPEGDQYGMACFDFYYNTIPVGTLYFKLTDASGLAFVSDALPTVPPDLDDFAYSEFVFVGMEDPLQVLGTVEYLFPEPTSILLVLLGAGLLRRRRTLAR